MQIKAGNADSVRSYFDDAQNGELVKKLVNVLTNQTGTNGKTKPIFKVTLNTEDAKISFINPELATALVVTRFDHTSLPTERSSILFTIHKTADKQYKISQADLKNFLADYSAFQIKVINKTIPEKDIYSPITLAAFKTAGQLKTRYDSVLWFHHINNQTFYYVIKGTISEYYSWSGEYTNPHDNSDFKMGLVNPDLKEIIPVEYSLIHNIGGTVDGLIEVEKGDKKGFYDITGKLVVPANYEQIYPLKSEENLALLKDGMDYYYLKADTTISEKIADFKIADILPQIKDLNRSLTLSDKSSANIMEANSRIDYNSIVIPPSYLVSLKLLGRILNFQNPLRKLSAESQGDGDGSLTLSIKFDGDKKDDDNWFQSAFYSVVDDYLGGRSGLYVSKTVLLVDKKQNRLLGFNASNYMGEEEGGGELSGTCTENKLRQINDSLFEFKTTAELQQILFDNESIIEGPYYHYLQIKNGQLVALPSERLFPTQYVKLDDTYLQGCFVLGEGDNTYRPEKTKSIDHVSTAILEYMKNEIYASYHYKFKNPKWAEVFDYRFADQSGGDEKKNVSVDDSLTTIDKYNINFINSKLKVQKTNTLAAQ